MKTVGKIIIAGVVGTTFMTLYSYLKSKKENKEYTEPIIINKLIDNSKNLPSVQKEESHPAGWVLHYATGISFVTMYWLMWKRALIKPTVSKVLIIGLLSGLSGIAVWKLLFAQHNNPPNTNRYRYYKQLFEAHIIFSFFALGTYKILHENTKK